jgi:hypothetical protein
VNFHPPTDGRWAMAPRPFQVGDTVTLDDRHEWTVKAVTANFAALTRPTTSQDVDTDDDLDGYDTATVVGEPLYTILDWWNGVRGPVNLSGKGWRKVGHDDADYAALLTDFEAGLVEVSHRNWVRIELADVEPAR